MPGIEDDWDNAAYHEADSLHDPRIQDKLNDLNDAVWNDPEALFDEDEEFTGFTEEDF